jgi:hypothetical protein
MTAPVKTLVLAVVNKHEAIYMLWHMLEAKK